MKKIVIPIIILIILGCNPYFYSPSDYSGILKATPNTNRPKDFFEIEMGGSRSAKIIHHQSSPRASITYTVSLLGSQRSNNRALLRLSSIEDLDNRRIIKKDGIFDSDQEPQEPIVNKGDMPEEIVALFNNAPSEFPIYYHNAQSLSIHGFRFLEFSKLPSVDISETCTEAKEAKIDSKPLKITYEKNVALPGSHTERKIVVAQFGQ